MNRLRAVPWCVLVVLFLALVPGWHWQLAASAAPTNAGAAALANR